MKKISNVFWVVVIVLIVGYFIHDRIPNPSKLVEPSYNGTYTTTNGRIVLILDDGVAYNFWNAGTSTVMFKGYYNPEDSEIHWSEGYIKSHEDWKYQYDVTFGLSQIRVYGDEYLPIEISESGNKITADLYDLTITENIKELQSDSHSWDMENLSAYPNHDITLRKLSDSTDISYYEGNIFGSTPKELLDDLDSDYDWLDGSDSDDDNSNLPDSDWRLNGTDDSASEDTTDNSSEESVDEIYRLFENAEWTDEP